MYLGIDVGTQSVKALLYDAEASAVSAVESAPLDLVSESDGTREQEAAWWVDALCDCIARLPKDGRSSVSGIGVSGQQHGFVPLDAGDEVLAPVKLWCDTATTVECGEITAAFGGEARCIEEVGNAILPGYTASKILWMKKYRPGDYRNLATVLLPHDYINLVLTGERVMEYGDASGTGLLDIRARRWHGGMLAAVDPDRDLTATLPPLVDPAEPIGRLRNAVAGQLGLPPGVPVSSGGGDNMMAAIGTGSVAPGRMTVSLGTSGTLFASADEPVVDPEGAIAAFCSSTGGWLPLLCTMNCTVSTELTRELLGTQLAGLEDAVASVPPGSGGVVTLPFFNGERTPNLPAAKGCLLGLDESNYTRENLLRSAMESAVYGLRTGLDAFRRVGCAVDRLRLTGGGARSGAWRQMVADVFELPVSVQTCDEGAALGAALQALWVDRGGDLRELVDAHLAIDASRSCEPAPATVEKYRVHFASYQRHVDVVRRLYE
jgi:xylulokinase